MISIERKDSQVRKSDGSIRIHTSNGGAISCHWHGEEQVGNFLCKQSLDGVKRSKLSF